jgi:hypothetical protein
MNNELSNKKVISIFKKNLHYDLISFTERDFIDGKYLRIYIIEVFDNDDRWRITDYSGSISCEKLL